MSDEAPTRREKLAINAIDPITGDELTVFISYERLQAIGKRSKGQVLEAAFLVPQVLQSQGAVFEGLCTEEDEDKHGVGWRCYCLIPDCSYTADGEKCPPRRRQIFLVFVNEENVAYNWRWDKADPDDPNLPLGYQQRFKERLR